MQGTVEGAVESGGEIEQIDDGALTPLHPNYLKLLRVQSLIGSAPLAIGALIAETVAPLPPGVIAGPMVLLIAFLVFRIARRRHKARGYAVSDDRLRVVRGLLYHVDTFVPFGRVQHIDVNAGPLERMFGLATLTVHTAGNHNASVHLPGLANETATELREAIRQRIKRDTL